MKEKPVLIVAILRVYVAIGDAATVTSLQNNCFCL